MLLRDHPLMSYRGLPSWPPAWTWIGGLDNKRPQGEMPAWSFAGSVRTAGGVVFMPLEDETGFVNVVIWESVFQRYSVLAKTMSL
jgi:hypothetical protein